MIFTKCLRCGKELTEGAETRDGLCGTLDGGTGCAQRFWDWLGAERRDAIRRIPGFGRSAEWKVALDEYLSILPPPDENQP